MLTSRRSQLILSHNIIVDGASCNRSNMANHKVQASLHSAIAKSRWIVASLLGVPYVYAESKVKKPPDGSFYDEVLNAVLVLSIFAYIYLGLSRQWLKTKYKQRGRKEHDASGCCYSSDPGSISNASSRMSRQPKIFATETDGNTNPPISFTSDGIPFAVDNCANAHVTNQKHLFVGPLKPSGPNVLSADSQRSRRGVVVWFCGDDRAR